MFASDYPGIAPAPMAGLQNILTRPGEATLGMAPAPMAGPNNPIKTVVMLLSCQKTEDRRQACRETWMAHGVPDDMRVVFLVGRPGREPALAGDVLYLDCPDTYLALPQKTWNGIREVLLRWDAEWIFKADDDTFVNLQRIRHYPRSHDYIGRAVPTVEPLKVPWHVGRCKYETREAASVRCPAVGAGPSSYPAVGAGPRYSAVEHTPSVSAWAGGGVGWFLSRRAARLIAREPKSHVAKEAYEDKFVGDVMASYGIRLHGQHTTLRPLPVRNRRVVDYKGVVGATTLHPLMPDEMKYAYWLALRAGEIGT
jgi:hypothetical protein